MEKNHNVPLPIGKTNWNFVYANFTLRYIKIMYMHNTRKEVIALLINSGVSYYMCLSVNKVDHMKQLVVIWLAFV
jgi:hypothetical protein